MGSGINFEQRRVELAIGYIPTVSEEIKPPPTESDIGFIADQVATTNPTILVESETAVNSIEDEAFNHPDLIKAGNTIALTREQLRGLLSRAALSGVYISVDKIGSALKKKAQTSYLIDTQPLDLAEA